MAELKTQKTTASVPAFIASIKDDATRKDCQTLVKIMREVVGAPPRMWGPTIVGFGDLHYTGAGGKGTDWFICGFSPRKQNLTLYIMGGLEPHTGLLKRLGKHSTGKACLYLKRLADVDMKVLTALIAQGVKQTASLTV